MEIYKIDRIGRWWWIWCAPCSNSQRHTILSHPLRLLHHHGSARLPQMAPPDGSAKVANHTHITPIHHRAVLALQATTALFA